MAYKYMELLDNCTICPRNCGVDRNSDKQGYCSNGSKLRLARAALHFWEEPCVSGESGSGTVFFSGCNLKCVFCQNYNISQDSFGKDITIERLADIFLELESKNALNINLVTPTHYVPQIINAIEIARSKNLKIPIVYNSSGYEKPETIKILDGYIDVYIPDLKYYDDKYSLKYSNAKDYFKFASEAITEMVRQVGAVSFDKNGIIKKGVIIRHMLLPGLLFDSKKVIDYIYSNFGNSVYLSLMNQYTPMNKSEVYPEINKPISQKYYDSIINYALSIGIENGFIQEEGTVSESFIPPFDLEGV